MSNGKGEFEIFPTESETIRTVGSIPRGNWETPEVSTSSEVDRLEKARCHNANLYVSGNSDSLVVPEKQANNAGPSTAAESVEERRLTKENVKQSLLLRTQRRGARSRRLSGVRETARKDQKARFNKLLNHVTPELLRASFFGFLLAKSKRKLDSSVHADRARIMPIPRVLVIPENNRSAPLKAGGARKAE